MEKQTFYVLKVTAATNLFFPSLDFDFFRKHIHKKKFIKKERKKIIDLPKMGVFSVSLSLSLSLSCLHSPRLGECLRKTVKTYLVTFCSPKMLQNLVGLTEEPSSSTDDRERKEEMFFYN